MKRSFWYCECESTGEIKMFSHFDYADRFYMRQDPYSWRYPVEIKIEEVEE